jgi:hypothetical protein
VLTPITLDTTGALKPWMMPDDHAIVNIWNLVFGQEYGLDDDDVEGETFLVVKALVCAHTITKRTLTTT